MAPQEYREKKEKVAGEIVGRLEAKLFPGLSQGIHFMEVVTVYSLVPHRLLDVPAFKGQGPLGL